MEIHFQGDTTDQIIARMLRLKNKKPWYGYLIRILIYIAAPLYFNFTRYNYWFILIEHMPKTVMLEIGFWIMLWILLIVLMFKPDLRPAIKVVKLIPANRFIFGNRAGVISSEFIKVTMPELELKVSWRVFRQKRITEDIVLLFSASKLNPTFLYAREFFATDTDWQAFITLVKEKLPEKK